MRKIQNQAPDLGTMFKNTRKAIYFKAITHQRQPHGNVMSCG